VWCGVVWCGVSGVLDYVGPSVDVGVVALI
jgi:hypothetical protein